MRANRFTVGGAITGACLCLALSACGSSSSQAGSPDSSGPIKIMNISILSSQIASFPEIATAFKAEVDQVNAAGGIHGRKLDGILCNDQFSAAGAASCARQAVADKVVAVVGSLSANSANAIPILAQAGIPWVAGIGTVDLELQSPDSFPIYAGSVAASAGEGQTLARLGDKSIVIFISGGQEPLSEAATVATSSAKAAGVTDIHAVTVPPNSPSVTAQVQAGLAYHPTGVVLALTNPDTPTVISALRQAGYKGPITSPPAQMTPQTIKALGAQANGIYLLDTTLPASDTSSPGIRMFRASMLKAGAPAVQIDDVSKRVWLGVYFFQQLLKDNFTENSSITPKTVIHALDHPAKPISLGGVAPNWDGSPTAPPVKEFPRVGAFEAVLSRIINGVPTLQGGFFVVNM